MTTRTTTTTYLVYQYPRFGLPEECVESVEARDPQLHANNAPQSAFAFYYFDIVTTDMKVNGKRIETSSDPCNVSRTYYIDAELLTADQVAALPGDHSSLLENMSGNGWDPIVRCRTGNFQPFDKGDHELLMTS